MSLNPSKLDSKDSPIVRANDVNDLDFQNQQGYYPYNLSHSELLTTRFGEITPSMVLDTVPADRFVCQENTKLIRNQINGNLLSTLNQYSDSFFVSLRTLYPTNYEKLIPNPTKGQDLPNSALPQVPFSLFVNNFLFSEEEVNLLNTEGPFVVLDSNSSLMNFESYFEDTDVAALSNSYALSRYLLLSTILSRGQLLDALGCQFDMSSLSSDIISEFQLKIDALQYELYNELSSQGDFLLFEMDLSLSSNNVTFDPGSSRRYHCVTLSDYRSAISDIFERGKMIYFGNFAFSDQIADIVSDFRSILDDLFDSMYDEVSYIENINASSNPFQTDHLSLTRPLAYQLCVAQYFSNDSIDNIFTSDLYMQLLRAVMYPSTDGFSSEPTFTYNGVTTEYDYISAGGFYYSLISNRNPGHLNRQYVFSTLMFLLRRSLRYGDYFSTARPRMLAVGDLSINVVDGMVSPIDVTQNLLKQRYLNAANYIGSGFMQQMSSFYGVIPSDLGSKPRFVSHRKTVLQNQITNNTGSVEEQGYQTTNLVGYSSDAAFDVFIDDFGILLTVQSYDVLPVYTSGIDNGFNLTDRFDYFNPMLQNIGDQPIYLSEMVGDPKLHDKVFGYTMRNAEYKFKNSRAHGAFCTNELAGYLMKYPLAALKFGQYGQSFNINPDFIRDKPMYIDSLIGSSTGVSPCQYWHFVVSANNVVQCARKIQTTPPVLF